MDQDKKRLTLIMGRRGACMNVVAALSALDRQVSVAQMWRMHCMERLT